MFPPFTSIIQAIPATVPFVGPETLERRSGRQIELRLGANESPFGPSELAVAAMQAQANQAQFYGDPECYLLRSRLSDHLEIPLSHISVGAGIDELLAVCCRLFVSPGDSIVTSLGSYPTFEFGGVACGAQFLRVPYRDEAPDLDRLLEVVKSTQAKILYLANPDNPSGAFASADAIGELVGKLPPSCMLFLDEAYIDFAPEVPPIADDNPQVIRFRTFSKAHGLAGMRVGYVMTATSHVEALDKIRMHFGVNKLGQAGALASLDDAAHVANVVQQTNLGRIEIVHLMKSLGLRTLPSHTNFVTIDVESKTRAEKLLSLLLDQGVFIRKPGMPPLDGCIRVTIGHPEQRARFAEIFESVLPTL